MHILIKCLRNAFKTICPEGDIGTYRREGVKNIHFIQLIKEGTYSFGGRGKNLFATYPMSTFVILFPHKF